MLATLVVGSALVAAMTSLSTTARTQAVLATGPTTALTLANEIHTLALSLPRTAGDGSPARAGSEVAVLDDLDGAIFSPPIDARKAALTSSIGWTQTVDVEPIDLAGAGEDEEDASSSTLLKLTVAVRQGSAAAGTFTWWINP